MLGGLIVLTLFIGGGIAGSIATGDGTLVALATIFGTIITIIILVTSIPALFAGYGIIRHKPWGRILGIVVGILNLFNFPIGTVIGGYAQWVLFNLEVASKFNQHAHNI